MAGALEKYMAKKAAKKAIGDDGDIPMASKKAKEDLVPDEDSDAMKKGKLSVADGCKPKKRPYMD